MMDRPMNNLSFRFMSIYFRFPDYFFPPIKILAKVGIPAGFWCHYLIDEEEDDEPDDDPPEDNEGGEVGHFVIQIYLNHHIL
jgi:hypothetical protein